MDAPVRQLTAKEAAVIWRELRADARGMQVLGWSCLAFVLLCAGSVPFTLAEGLWFFTLCAAGVAVPLFLLAKLLLLGRRRRPTHGNPTPRAERAEALCQMRNEGTSTRANWVRYVGHYRVGLRAGWDAFWPEGQVAEVELCFPEGLGPTRVSAAVVTLPGIDIERWLRRPPPGRARFGWSFAWAAIGGILTVVGAMDLLRGDRWVSGTSGPSPSLLWLVAALGLSSVASGVTAVRLQRRYRRDLRQWADAIRRDTLEP